MNKNTIKFSILFSPFENCFMTIFFLSSFRYPFFFSLAFLAECWIVVDSHFDGFFYSRLFFSWDNNVCYWRVRKMKLLVCASISTTFQHFSHSLLLLRILAFRKYRRKKTISRIAIFSSYFHSAQIAITIGYYFRLLLRNGFQQWNVHFNLKFALCYCYCHYPYHGAYIHMHQLTSKHLFSVSP